jgi:hypothetical protein
MMRSLLSPVCAIALVCIFATPAVAQDLAGTWLFDVDLDAGTGQAGFTFSVDGTSVTGTYTGILGEHELTGTIEGNRELDGDTIEGTCEYGQLGSGGFLGNRTG